MGRILVLAIVVSGPLGARAEEPAPAAAVAEPMWRTVVLAPGRVVASGRFDAATPSYRARKADEKAKREAVAAEQCRPCVCTRP